MDPTQVHETTQMGYISYSLERYIYKYNTTFKQYWIQNNLTSRSRLIVRLDMQNGLVGQFYYGQWAKGKQTVFVLLIVLWGSIIHHKTSKPVNYLWRDWTTVKICHLDYSNTTNIIVQYKNIQIIVVKIDLSKLSQHHKTAHVEIIQSFKPDLKCCNFSLKPLTKINLKLLYACLRH